MAPNGPYAPGLGVPPMGYAPPPRHRGPELTLQRGLLMAMLPLHALMLLHQGISLVTCVYVVVTELRGNGVMMHESGVLFAELAVTIILVTWALGGGLWAIKLLRDFDRPSPRFVRSIRNYWRFSALSCFCFPLGVIGLVNMKRPEVERALSGAHHRFAR